MKKLVRGSIVLSILSMFVVFVYAQTQEDGTSDIANNSQTQLNIENNFSADIDQTASVDSTALVSDQDNKVREAKKTVNAETPQEFDLEETNSNKSIKKTASTRATGGVNRGSFSATAYCLKGRTASGTGVRSGIIAADPRVLPLGTRVALSGGRSGNFVVSDTGGKIKGKRIDIWMASCSEARRFGRRNVTISVLN